MHTNIHACRCIMQLVLLVCVVPPMAAKLGLGVVPRCIRMAGVHLGFCLLVGKSHVMRMMTLATA